MAEFSGWTQLLVAYLSVGAFALPFVHKLKVLKYIQFGQPDLIIWPTVVVCLLLFTWILNDFRSVYFDQFWWAALVLALALFFVILLLSASYRTGRSTWMLAVGILLNVLMLAGVATSAIVAFSEFVFFHKIEITLEKTSNPSKYSVVMKDGSNTERVTENFGSSPTLVIFLTQKQFDSIETIDVAASGRTVRVLTLRSCKEAQKRVCPFPPFAPEG